MRAFWGHSGRESIDLFDGVESKDKKFVYRIVVVRAVKDEVKIVQASGKAKIISNENRLKIVDIVFNCGLFTEFVGGNGFAFGW